MSIKGVALLGKMRSGKSLIGDILVEEYGLTAFSFGEALKHFAHEIFPWVPADPKPRDLYQFMNVMREYDPDVWVRQLFDEEIAYKAKLRARAAHNPLIPVITDARQLNEVEACRERGYTIIRVEADEATRRRRIYFEEDVASGGALAHVTETEVDAIEADYTIDNGAGVTKAELRAQVVAIMEALLASSKREHTARVR